MARRIRLYKIATRLGVSAETLVERCQKVGITSIKCPLSMVPKEIEMKIYQWYAGEAEIPSNELKRKRGKVFISYRRNTGSELSRTVQRHLENTGFKTFLDVDTLNSGWFSESLIGELKIACAVVVILTPDALSDCTDPNDWIRKEISCAIKLHKHIVPLKMPDFTFPQLPDEIAKLPKYNCVEYSHTYFEATMMRLESEVGRACKRNKQFEDKH